MPDYGYLALVGKEGFRERIWTHFDATAASPTVGTAINADPTVYASNEAMICINNKGSRTGTPASGSNVMVIPVCIELITTARGTAGTFAAIGLGMDASTVFASGGATLAARYLFKDTRSGWAARTGFAQAQFGDLTIATTTLYAFNGWWAWSMQATPFAIGDTFRFNFGGNEGGSGGYNTASDAGIGAVTNVPLPPICIAPGCSLIVHPFITDMSAGASFMCTVTAIELGLPREST